MHMEIAIEDFVLIKGDNKHRDKQNIGIVEELYEGKNNIIRAVKLWSKKTYFERSIQFLYSLQLSCERQKIIHQCRMQPLNVNASEL